MLLYICVDQSIKTSKPYSSVTTEEQLEKVISENNYIIIDARIREEYEKDVIVYAGDEEESNLACTKLIESGYGGLDIGAYDTITLEKE